MKTKIFTTLALLIITSTSVFATQPVIIPLNDIQGHIYQSAIEELYRDGVVRGDEGKETFRPNSGINRAEITKVIARATDPGVAFSLYNKNCFPDVKIDQWYTPYVCYAKDKGWVKGFDDGLFRPAQNVTNFEAMKIAAKSRNIPFVEEEPWYKNLVDILAKDNLIPFTVNAPHANLTRGEMTDLILRIKKFQTAPAILNNYLKQQNRDGINVTMETINQKLDLSTLERQEVCASGSC